MTKSRGILVRVKWRPEDDALLVALYPDTKTEEVAARLGRRLYTVYQRAYSLGLHKSEAFRASPASGRTNGRQGIGSRFVKGQTPANKGKKCGPAEGGNHPNARRTQFVKGARRGVAEKLWKPIGTERLSKDGYIERKVNDSLPLRGRWRAVHLVRWEEIHGPLPKGYALKCLDGERQNTDPSNWKLIPRGLLPRLNGGRGKRLAYDDAPAELKPTVMAIAELAHAAGQRSA